MEPVLPPPLRNPQKRVGKVLWILVAASAAASLVVLPFGEPVSRLWLVGAVVGGCLLIPALICQFVMIPRVERRLRAFRSGKYLAHWLYDRDEWERWREVCATRWQKRLREPSGEVFIDRDGVYYDGWYESWTLSFNYWLQKVEIHNGRPEWLEITYGWSSGGHHSYSTVRVPIPGSEFDKAEEVVAELRPLVRPR